MKAKFSSSKTFDEAQKFQKAPKPDELVDVLPPNPKEWQSLRFVGPLVSVGGHWLNTEPPVQGKKTKAFYKPCLAFNPETEERDSTKYCPYCADESGWIRPDLVYWQNAIVTSLEEDMPAKPGKRTDKEKDSGFKEKGSKAWTPVRAVRLTGGTVRELKKLSMLNRHMNKKTQQKKAYPLAHEKYGAVVELMYDPDEAPAKKYAVQKGEKSRLTEEQQEYLVWNIEKLVTLEKDSEAKAEYARWKKMAQKSGLGEDEAGDDSDEDEDRMKSKKKKGGKDAKASKKSKSRDEDDEDEDEDDEDEDNEFSSDKKKSKKSKKKSKSKDEDDEDEESDDEDDEDEDEDDEPKSKKKSKKSKGKKKSKKSRDEDDEDDEDEDED